MIRRTPVRETTFMNNGLFLVNGMQIALSTPSPPPPSSKVTILGFWSQNMCTDLKRMQEQFSNFGGQLCLPPRNVPNRNGALQCIETSQTG